MPDHVLNAVGGVNPNITFIHEANGDRVGLLSYYYDCVGLHTLICYIFF
jgi:hypothetical protein